MADSFDFYADSTAETRLKHTKTAPYIDLAEKQGDAIIMEKAWEMRIIIKRPKPEKAKDVT